MKAAETLAFMGLGMVHASVTVSIYVFHRQFLHKMCQKISLKSARSCFADGSSAEHDTRRATRMRCTDHSFQHLPSDAEAWDRNHQGCWGLA